MKKLAKLLSTSATVLSVVLSLYATEVNATDTQNWQETYDYPADSPYGQLHPYFFPDDDKNSQKQRVKFSPIVQFTAAGRTLSTEGGKLLYLMGGDLGFNIGDSVVLGLSFFASPRKNTGSVPGTSASDNIYRDESATSANGFFRYFFAGDLFVQTGIGLRAGFLTFSGTAIDAVTLLGKKSYDASLMSQVGLGYQMRLYHLDSALRGLTFYLFGGYDFTVKGRHFENFNLTLKQNAPFAQMGIGYAF